MEFHLLLSKSPSFIISGCINSLVSPSTSPEELTEPVLVKQLTASTENVKLTKRDADFKFCF